MRNVDIFHFPYLGIYVNSFRIEAKDKNILIDTGLSSGRSALVPYANAATAILCTHGHWDHIGNHRFLQSGGAAVYAHPADGKYLADFAWHWNTLFAQFAADFQLPAARRTTFAAEIGEPVDPDECLWGGETLHIGDCVIEVISTPGHSAGSVCFFLPEDGLLFSGDSLMGDGFFTGIPQYTDTKAYRASMEKLMNLTVETVYCDHNEPIPGKLLKAKAERGILCMERIGRSVREFAAHYTGEPEDILKEAVKHICAAEGKNPGGGACVSVLTHLIEMGAGPKTEACIRKHVAL